MNRSTKIWLTIAAFLVIGGLLIFAGALNALKYDFTKLNTQPYITNVYEIDEDFDNISIDTRTADITFAQSNEARNKVECFDVQKVSHSATVQDGTLKISTNDARKWYDHIGVFFERPKITVYLSEDEYKALVIETHTGDIDIPHRYSFESIRISGNTSDVCCSASVSGRIEVNTDTGSIELATPDAGEIKLAVGTGKIKLTGITCESLSAKSNTGDMQLNNVVAEKKFTINTNTGDVSFENSDAAEICVKTNTGKVTGTLLSEKIFVVRTSSGKVNIPYTAAGGKCEITTGSGNIRIDLA